MYKPGLVSISFRALSYEEVIELTVRAGLKSIEWGSDVHAPCHDTERLRAVAKATRNADLDCCSYGTYFRLGVTDLSELHDYIAAAKILGTDILRLWCGDKGHHEYGPEERKKLILACKEAAKIAGDAGVALCLECHNNTYTDCLEGATEIMEAVNSDHFRMYWQPNQYRTFEENLAYAREIAELTTHLHVFNWQGNLRFPLAEAVDIWKAYLENFKGKHQLLLEFMPDDRPESLITEAKALETIIKEVES